MIHQPILEHRFVTYLNIFEYKPNCQMVMLSCLCPTISNFDCLPLCISTFLINDSSVDIVVQPVQTRLGMEIQSMGLRNCAYFYAEDM